VKCRGEGGGGEGGRGETEAAKVQWDAETGPVFKLMSPHNRRSRDGNSFCGL